MHPSGPDRQHRTPPAAHDLTPAEIARSYRLYRAATRAGRPDNGAPTPISPALWTCEACHNLNEPTHTICHLCGRPRAARRGTL